MNTPDQTPQDQTQADELDKQLDNLLTWDFDGVKEPLIFADPMRTAIKKLVLSYANQRALKLLDELEKFINNPQDTPYFDKDAYDNVSNFIEAKRLNLTKRTGEKLK